MVVIVDIQGFNLKNEDSFWGFYPKEITIYDGHKLNYYLLKPPTPYQNLSPINKQQVRCIERLHGLIYSNGNVEYYEISKTLKSILQNLDLIYVKGSQKYQYLIDLNLKNVKIINLETWEENVPPKIPSSISPSCFNHSKYIRRWSCSTSNCIFLYKWLINNNVLNRNQ